MDRKSRIIEIYSILFIDCLCMVVSYLLALILRFGELSATEHRETYMLMCVWFLLFVVLYDTFIGSGRNFLRRGYYVECKSGAKQLVSLVIFASCSLFLLKEAENFSRLVYGYFVIAYGILMFLAHACLKKILRAHLKADRSRVKVLVVAEEQDAATILALLKKNVEYDCEITGAVIWDADRIGQSIEGISVVASGENLIDVARTMPVDEVFMHLPETGKRRLKEVIMNFETMGVVCHYNIDVADFGTKVQVIEQFGGFSVVTYAVKQMDYRKGLIKRLIDIIGGLVGILLTGVCYPFIALAIKMDSKGPVVFSQVRIGKNGRRFKIYKFRSMYIDAEERKKELEARNEVKGLMFKMEDDPRVTTVGKFLRKTSLDELPQFLNVLKGDMSLVGTRPPTVDEFEQYTPYYRRRLCMTPGLTGMWQVSGRSNVDNFDDVVKYDLHYIDHWSLSLDIKILFQTVFVVLFGKGAK